MPLPTRDVIGILTDNLRLRGSVLPIPARRATRWARELDLPRGGETVLYTGMMYQLIPYIERLVDLERRIGDSPLSRFSGVARRANRLVNGAALVARPSAAERAEYDRVPANVAKLLRNAGVEFGYLYEDDLYSGALAHDLGADSVVAAHAQRVARSFRRYGVKEVITIDPHTTTMLRSVYPTLVEDYDVRVRSYLEVLAKRGSPAQQQAVGRGRAPRLVRVRAVRECRERASRSARRDRPRGCRAEPCREIDVVLRGPGGGAVPRQGGGRRLEAGRAAGRSRARLRDDVPDLPGQPSASRRRERCASGISPSTWSKRRHPLVAEGGCRIGDCRAFARDGAAPESNRASLGLPDLTGFEDHWLEPELLGAVLALLAFRSASATVCATVRGAAMAVLAVQKGLV